MKQALLEERCLSHDDLTKDMKFALQRLDYPFRAICCAKRVATKAFALEAIAHSVLRHKAARKIHAFKLSPWNI